MPLTSSDYKGTDLALLLLGGPKTGKTVAAGAFPDPYFLCLDGNIGPTLRFHPNKRIDFDYGDRTLDGKILPIEQQWDHVVNVLSKTVATRPEYKTVIIDHAGRLSDMLCAKIIAGPSAEKDLIVGGIKTMTMHMWYPYKMLMERYISIMRQLGKILILICHTKSEKDEVLGTVRYVPALPGQFGDVVGGLFTDVWCCETKNSAGGVSYVIRTMPTPRMQLGNSLGLPAEFEMSWETLAAKLGGTK